MSKECLENKKQNYMQKSKKSTKTKKPAPKKKPNKDFIKKVMVLM